jgi:hypothetical protein
MGCVAAGPPALDLKREQLSPQQLGMVVVNAASCRRQRKLLAELST